MQRNSSNHLTSFTLYGSAECDIEITLETVTNAAKQTISHSLKRFRNAASNNLLAITNLQPSDLDYNRYGNTPFCGVIAKQIPIVKPDHYHFFECSLSALSCATPLVPIPKSQDIRVLKILNFKSIEQCRKMTIHA